MVPLFSSSFDLTCLMDGDKISVLGLKSLTSQPKAYKSNSDHHYSRLKSFSNPTYSTKLDSLPHFLSQINFRFFLFFWGGAKILEIFMIVAPSPLLLLMLTCVNA